MAAVVDAGREFVKSTYKLEGDSPLVLDCYECLQTVLVSIHVSKFPNVDAIIKTISADHNSQQRLKLHALACVKPGLDYFISKYTGDLSKQISAFQAARLFVHHKIVQLSPTAVTVDLLSSFPLLVPLLPALKTELPTYLALASGITIGVEPSGWWKENKSEFPHWSPAFSEVVLIQPSSAAAERVFSLLKNSFNEQQDLALQDYLEASLMLQYNCDSH